MKKYFLGILEISKEVIDYFKWKNWIKVPFHFNLQKFGI